MGYRFFVEVRGHHKDPSLENVLRELKGSVSHVTILGSFADMGNVVGSRHGEAESPEQPKKRMRT
jgi:prephenate dehydratase